jgi:hypothetical protein
VNRLNITEALINLAVQTIILVIVLVSMRFRMKDKYNAHVITIAVAVILSLVIASFGSLNFLDSDYIQTITNPITNLVVWVSHEFFGIASQVSGIILLALLLMDKAIAHRSDMVAKVTAVLWVVAYIAGIAFFVILHL